MNISSELSSFLNFLRWVSALLVVLSHLRAHVFVTYDLLENKSILAKAFYFFTSLGHEAVMVFFVLSGFFVGGSVIEKIKRNDFALKEYIINRLSRLYTVLIPALLLSALIALYLKVGYGIAVENFNLQDFAGSLFFLQTIFFNNFANNSPLWSLANEFWYYILFPILAYLYYNPKNFLPYLFLAILCLFLPNSILVYFFIFLIGAFAYNYKKKILPVSISIILLIISIVISRSFRLTFDFVFLLDFFVAFSVFLLINSMQEENVFLKVSVKFIKLNKIFADFSYSLYLLHFPAIVLLGYLVIEKNISLNYVSITEFMGYLFLLYIYSFIVASLTEHKTDRVRNKIRIFVNKGIE